MARHEILEWVVTATQVESIMKLGHSSEDDTSSSSRAPLIPIGLAIVAVLIVPMVLYSVGPEGPLKIGDVVFVRDRHRVKFVDPSIPSTQGYRDFCILESRVQLVLQNIDSMAGNLMVAQPIGVEKIDVPFCPPRISVLLQPYHVTLKADLWGSLQDTLLTLVSE